MNIILDACAVIAFLRNETGADVVIDTFRINDHIEAVRWIIPDLFIWE